MVNISIASIVCSLSTSLSQNNYGTPFGPGYSLYLLRRMPLLSLLQLMQKHFCFAQELLQRVKYKKTATWTAFVDRAPFHSPGQAAFATSPYFMNYKFEYKVR
jgi:hypothetical protein